MASLKSLVNSSLRPIRLLGGRFFIPPPAPVDDRPTIVWKAAQLLAAELVFGDYLEFGVFQGASFAQAFTTIHNVCRYWGTFQDDPSILARGHSPEHREKVRQVWNDMRFFAFDSFQGLPAPSGLDRRSQDFSSGQYSCALDGFLENLRKERVDLNKVVAVPGWFEETCAKATIQKHSMKTASIVHIDCDLYESAKVVLKFIEPLMTDGTVLIFDDWYCFRGNPDLGEQRAFREWAASKPDWTFTEYQKEGPGRNSFIANRKPLMQSGE